jgi:serine/threonine protein kinase
VLSAICQTNLTSALLKAFVDEVEMLASLRHPNICLYMAACIEPPNRAIVTELVSRGSLWEVLRTPSLFEVHVVISISAVYCIPPLSNYVLNGSVLAPF